jgi:HK97 family phage portal protein
MNILKRILSPAPRIETRDGVTFADIWGRDAQEFGLATAADVNVNVDLAMQVSAVFGAFRILSDNIATLPLDVYTSDPNRGHDTQGAGRYPFRPRPAWASFECGCNKIDLISQVVVSLLSDGNAFVAVYRDARLKILSLEVLDPKLVTVERIGGQRMFRINGGDMLTALDILHIRGMTLPGSDRGASPIHYARESIGLSYAATRYGAGFFGNGGLPGLVVEVPGELSPTGIKQLKRGWDDVHKGSGNAHKLAVLTEGAKFSKVTIDPEDAQFLQTRQFQVPDIARIFGVPPHLLADATNSTSWGSGLAEQNTAFVQHTLRPLIERIEQGFNALLKSEGYPDHVFAKLSVDGLLRGSHKQRLESYAIGIQNGIYTVNEVRAWEDMPPLDDPSAPTEEEA